MNVLGSATGALTRAGDMAASAAGAVGGAILGGLAGSAQGAVNGIKTGADRGSRSTPMAALTIAVVGAAGLLEWPVLLGVGGGVLALRELRRHSEESAPKKAPTLTAVRGGGEKAAAPKPASKATRKAAPKAGTKGGARPRKASTTTTRAAARARRAPAKR